MALCSIRSGRAAAALAAVALLAGCSGTGSGDTGDPRTKPNPNEFGDGARITELVGPATWLSPGNMTSQGCAIPADRQAYLTGQVIVGIDKYDETGAGQTGNIYVQDYPVNGELAKPFSGITIFAPTFSPPDLRVFEGDLVDSFGNFTEFIGPSAGPFGDCKTLPEFNGTLTFRFEDTPPEPLVVVEDGASTDRFASIKGYANARQWLGMLVTLRGVTTPSAPKCDGCANDDCTMCMPGDVGRFSANVDIGGGIPVSESVAISNELMDVYAEVAKKYPTTPIAAGSTFKSITGIFTYFYGFKIAPRTIDDIEL